MTQPNRQHTSGRMSMTHAPDLYKELFRNSKLAVEQLSNATTPKHHREKPHTKAHPKCRLPCLLWSAGNVQCLKGVENAAALSARSSRCMYTGNTCKRRNKNSLQAASVPSKRCSCNRCRVACADLCSRVNCQALLNPARQCKKTYSCQRQQHAAQKQAYTVIHPATITPGRLKRPPYSSKSQVHVGPVHPVELGAEQTAATFLLWYVLVPSQRLCNAPPKLQPPWFSLSAAVI